MELPPRDRVPSLKFLALKQVYAREKRGAYSDKQRVAIAQIIAEETTEPFLHDIIDDRSANSYIEGRLKAHASGIGLVSHAGFWQYLTHALVEWPSGKLLHDLDSTEYRSIECAALSPDGRYCFGQTWDKNWHGIIFALDTKTGKKIFSCRSHKVTNFHFITNSVCIVGSDVDLRMIDVDNPLPQIIIENGYAEEFREFSILAQEWCIVRGTSRLSIYKKGTSLTRWHPTKKLRTPGIESLAVGEKKPIFMQLFSKKIKNIEALFAAFYQIVDGSVRYDATCKVADNLFSTSATATFFDDDRYCACAVLLNTWFNQSQINVVDLLGTGGPTVVHQISVESHPRQLFSDGSLLYVPCGIGSTHVLALNNWLGSQSKKSESTREATSDAFLQCSIL